MIISPILLAFIVQAWCNYNRFGNVLKFSDYSHYTKITKLKKTDLAEYNKQLAIKDFQINRIPSNFSQYFLYQKDLFINKFPYFNALENNSQELSYEKGSPIFPFPLIYSWIFIVSALGIFKILSSKDANESKIILSLLAIQVIATLMYKTTAHHYQANFLPLCTFTFFHYLHNLGRKNSFKGKLNLIISTILISYSILATTGFALNWRANNSFKNIEGSKTKARSYIAKVNRGFFKEIRKYLMSQGFIVNCD